MHVANADCQHHARGNAIGVNLSSSPSHEESTWTITKKVYKCHQADGGIVVRITYACPARDCQQEFGDTPALEDHVSHVHGVELSGSADRTKPAAGSYILPCITVANGGQRLVCTDCFMQFTLDARDELLEHIAVQHGRLCGLDGDKLNGQSEHLDLLHKAPTEHWFPRQRDVQRRMHVISLGSYCGVKISLQHMGLGEAHLPFDWIRSTASGIEHFVRNDFAQFFSVSSQCQVPNATMTMYRSERHSFWHDDVVSIDGQAKLQRRIDRFSALNEVHKDLLFVRSCATTDELAEVEDLYSALMARFGSDGESSRRVLLAVLVNGQEDRFDGPILHDNLPGVAFFAQTTARLTEAGFQSHSAYCKSIAMAVNMALAAPEGCHPWVGFGAKRDVLHGQLSEHVSVPSGACLVNAENSLMRFWDAGLHSGFGNLMCFEAPGSQLVHLKEP